VAGVDCNVAGYSVCYLEALHSQADAQAEVYAVGKFLKWTCAILFFMLAIGGISELDGDANAVWSSTIDIGQQGK
jgi:hypothetical protein